MNIRPVYYSQKDPNWKNKPYRVIGETSDIGGSGCGPTCASMLITTITGHSFDPVDACNWSMKNGYKALKQGTYYSYFTPQFKKFDIDCWQLSWTNTYNKPNSSIHKKALSYLKDGYYLIALMKKGRWTTTGHFIIVWWVDDKYVYINDPNSTAAHREKAEISVFTNEVAYYWIVDGRSINNLKEGSDEIMTQEEFDKMFETSMEKYRTKLRDNDASDWSQKARKYAIDNGIFSGSGNINGEPNFMWEDLVTREQAAQILYNFAEKHNLI